MRPVWLLASISLASIALALRGAGALRSARASEVPLEQFTPPSGRQANAAPGSPGETRLLLASSNDGLSFTRLGRLLSDQAATPNVVVDEQGRINAYYTGASIHGGDDGIAVAVSDDDGESWRHFRVRLLGVPAGLPPAVDPDVVRNGDGSYTLYFTNAVGRHAGIRYATSADGYVFDYGGVALQHSEDLLDSLTARLGSTYHMYAILPTTGEMAYATSSDGRTFAFRNALALRAEGAPQILSNWLSLGSGGARIFSFSLRPNRMHSFATPDGASLAPEAGERLSLGAGDAFEAAWVKDAAVARLRLGSYLMVYVSEIP